ncbi:J domain-containing protein [Mesorhizobium sp. BR1-1-16]|nr:J domain-containing protein [Mesorhizobium sp. BR1-1-16]
MPPEIILVIKIAAGCPISCAFAVAQTGLDEPALMRIATLYLLVVLFGQESDPHRTLGLAAGASPELVQDHRKWLLKWLHPDRNPNPNLAGLSVRVLAASAALAGAAAQLPVLAAEPQDAKAPTPVGTEGAERRRKYQLRHVWVPLRVDG